MNKNERNNNVNETHLSYIQDVIKRMGQNSFQSKGWCITLDSALIAFNLANRQADAAHVSIVIAIAVTVLFALVDTYYLYLERGYRYLYNMAAKIVERDLNYSDYVMTIPKCRRGFVQYLKTLFRFVTGMFYIVIIIGLILLLVF